MGQREERLKYFEGQCAAKACECSKQTLNVQRFTKSSFRGLSTTQEALLTTQEEKCKINKMSGAKRTHKRHLRLV
eukprot:2141263-Amphidinium_carterae.1